MIRASATACPVAILSALLFLLLAVLLSPQARAATTTVALYVAGPAAAAVRRSVAYALPADTFIADDMMFRDELARQGQRRPLGAELDAPALARILAAAKGLGIDVVLIAGERRSKEERELVLRVVDAAQGYSVLLRVGLDPRSRANDRETIAAALAVAQSGRAAAKPETSPRLTLAPKPEPEPEPEPEPAPARIGTRPVDLGVVSLPEEPKQVPRAAAMVASSWLDIELAVESAGRQFEYDNGISPAPRISRRPALPGIGIATHLFPLAALREAAGDVGLVAYAQRVFPATVVDIIPTELALGAEARVHPWGRTGTLFNISFAYSVTTFDSTGSGDEELPSVSYRAVRVALDTRIPLGRVAVLAGAAFREPVAPQSISTQFYHPTGYAADATFGFGWMVVPGLEARLVSHAQRYSFAFRPPAGALFAPGHALDDGFSLRLGLAFVF